MNALVDNRFVGVVAGAESVRQRGKPKSSVVSSTRSSSVRAPLDAEAYTPELNTLGDTLHNTLSGINLVHLQALRLLLVRSGALGSSAGSTAAAGGTTDDKATAAMNSSMLLAEVMSHEKAILKFLDTFVDAISKLSATSKALELALAQGLNAKEKAAVANCVTNWNAQQAQINAAKHESIWDMISDFFKEIINVVFLAVSIVEVVGELGANGAADAALGAQALLTVNSTIQLAAQMAVTAMTESGGNPSDLPSGVTDMARDGLLGLIHNKDLAESIDIFMNAATCLGGFGLVAGLLKDALKEGLKEGVKELAKVGVEEAAKEGSKEAATAATKEAAAAAKEAAADVAEDASTGASTGVANGASTDAAKGSGRFVMTKAAAKKIAMATAIGVETVLTTVGGIGSIFANPNSIAGKDLALISGGLISIVLVEITSGVISDLRRDGYDISPSTEAITDSVMTTIANIANIAIMYKTAQSTFGGADDTSAEAAPVARGLAARRSLDSGEDAAAFEMTDEFIAPADGLPTAVTDPDGGTSLAASSFAPPKAPDAATAAGDYSGHGSYAGKTEDEDVKFEMKAKPYAKGSRTEVKVGSTRDGMKVDQYHSDDKFNEGSLARRTGSQKTVKTSSDGKTANIYRKNILGTDVTLSFGRAMRTIGVMQVTAAIDKTSVGITQLVNAHLLKTEQTESAQKQEVLKQANLTIEDELQNITTLNQQKQSFNQDVSQFAGLRGQIASYVEEALENIANNEVY